MNLYGLLAFLVIALAILLATGEPQKIIRRYNWKRDKSDPRDVKFTAVNTFLPSMVDIRSGMPPVVNQGNLGSCTANALAGALGYLELKEQAAGDNRPQHERKIVFSPPDRPHCPAGTGGMFRACRKRDGWGGRPNIYPRGRT